VLYNEWIVLLVIDCAPLVVEVLTIPCNAEFVVLLAAADEVILRIVLPVMFVTPAEETIPRV
jgi:hypothetical protein